jgi:hypothetical protein
VSAREQAGPGRRAGAQPVRGAEQQLVGHGALEVEVGVVLPGDGDPAVLLALAQAA